MPDELLPPDPSEDGWYWVKQSDVGSDAWEWSSRDQKWAVGPWVITPEEAARHVILASPHPIPPPKQLDALHALQRDMQRSSTNWAGEVPSMAARLRAALEAKLLPNGPPGNGLADIRAAAMDQWGVPRAGDETTP